MKFTEKLRNVVAKLLGASMLLLLPACHIPSLRGPALGPEVPPVFIGNSPELVPPTVGGSGTSLEFIPPPNAEGVAAPGPDAVMVSDEGCPENSAQLGIVDFYRDPLLVGLIDQAVVGNRELMVLNEEVRIAGNEILARRGAYLPFVTYGTHIDVTKRSVFTPLGALDEQIEYLPGRNFPDPVPDYLMGLNLFWQLDIWRELRNARDAAGQRYIAVSEKRNYFVTTLVAEIAENYYSLMAFDKRLENLDQTIRLQEQSREIADARKRAGRDTELAVQRFEAEVRKNQSEKLIVAQGIIQAENRINYLVNRFPQPVERASANFFNLNLPALSAGVPAQLLRNRADIRAAERELAAAGLDIQVARAHFYPRLDIVAGVGYEAFDPKYLFWTPESLIYNAAADLAGPLINKKAIQAEYMSANARQLQAIYEYQRIILNAFTEVVNRVSMVQNYGRAFEIKQLQLRALDASVVAASQLFNNARAEYVEVLLAQRDLRDARMVVIDTKKEQLSAVVNAYQALGGGAYLAGGTPWPPPGPPGAKHWWDCIFK